jgi:dienelactone hydrolase
VTVRNGDLALKGLLWYPKTSGPVPAILFNHGRGCIPQPACDQREPKIRVLGSLFAEHGYAFLALFRRGEGLSAGVGQAATEQLERAERDFGHESATALQLRLLETEQLDDVQAGLEFLRHLEHVDRARLAIVGHSFGGSLSLLLGERNDDLGAVVAFGVAAQSWKSSSALQDRLIRAARRIRVPILLLYALNDYSIQPGRALASAIQSGGGTVDLRLLPECGTTAAQGHDAVYLATDRWTQVVFEFLGQHLPGKR